MPFCAGSMELGGEDIAMQKLAIAQFILEAAIIPMIILIFKFYTARTNAIADDKKKIVDLERKITKNERDAQYAEINHKFEELSNIVSANCKTMERLFERFDKMNDMIAEIRCSYKKED